MKACERRQAVMVGVIFAAVGILAILGSFVFVICFHWPFVCPWFERIGAVLIGGVLVVAVIGCGRYLMIMARARRIVCRQRGPVRTVCGREDGFIRFRVRM